MRGVRCVETSDGRALLARKKWAGYVPSAPLFAFYIEGSVRRSAPHIEGRPGHMRTTTTDSRTVIAGRS